MPDHLDQVASSPPKNKEMATERIALQHLLNLERQPRKAAAHVGMAGRQPHPHARGDGDHRPSAASRMRRRLSTSTPAPTRTTRPLPSAISIRCSAGSRLAAGGGEIGKASASTAASSAGLSVAGSARVTGTKVGVL